MPGEEDLNCVMKFLADLGLHHRAAGAKTLCNLSPPLVMVEEMVEDAMVDVAEGTEETAEMVGLK